MSALLRLNARAYGIVLLLYPADLRREFGLEMRELFGEDLADGWRNSGAAGVLRVWWCAVCEILRIAIPGQMENPAFAVPAISFVFSTFPLGSILAKAPSLGTRPLIEEIALFIVCPGLVSAFTALAAVHIGKTQVMSLDLHSCSKSAI
jgi:hypothetical protein